MRLICNVVERAIFHSFAEFRIARGVRARTQPARDFVVRRRSSDGLAHIVFIDGEQVQEAFTYAGDAIAVEITARQRRPKFIDGIPKTS